MLKTKILLKQHFCEKCGKDAVEKIEFPIGLSVSGPYTNEYCLECDARLRKSDTKEVESAFHCPECSSFLYSTTMNVCAGCGELLTRIRLDRRMFSLPRDEFKKELVALLQSSIPEEPKEKHKVDLQLVVCPFCDFQETIKMSEERWDDDIKGWSSFGIGSWECPQCGEENDLGLENFEKDFRPFKKFTEKGDWKGLLNFCGKNRFDDMMLSFLAKQYIQRREFKKAKEVGGVLLTLNPNDWDAQMIIERAEKGIKK